MRTPKFLPLFALATVLAIFVTACGGDGDNGGDGALELPPPGQYQFDITGTMEIELSEELVSAAPLALQQSQTIDLGGRGTIEIGPSGGTFNIPEFGLSGTFKLQDGDKTITITQNPDQPSTGQVGPDGTSLDLFLDFEVQDPSTGDVITGGYLFPVGRADDPVPLVGIDFDFFRPLILQFPDDLRRATLASIDLDVDDVGSISDMTLTLTPHEPLVDEGTDGEPEPGVTLPPNVEGIVSFFGVALDDYGNVMAGTDAPNDWILRDPNTRAGFTASYIDIDSFFAVRVTRSPDLANQYDAFLPCDSSFDDSQVVCAGDGPLSQDSYLFGEIFTDGVIPSEPDRFCTYAVVTDNGIPWIVNPPFDFDFLQDGGRWTQLVGRPDLGWDVFVEDVDEDVNFQQALLPAASDARAYILRDPGSNLSAIVLDIPVNELDGATGWRITADCNEAFVPEQSGGDVPGPDPTGGLLDLPPSPVPIFPDGFESGDTSAWSSAVP